MNIRPGRHGVTLVRVGVIVVGLALLVAWAQGASAQSTPIARIGVRVTSPATSRGVEGALFALDATGAPVADLGGASLQARLDGNPLQLSLTGPRPSIALTAAFWLDSSASPQVRDAAVNAVADGLQSLDVNRDVVALASTADATSWDQLRFTSSRADVQTSLNEVIQTTPIDSGLSLEQISSALRALAGQPRDTRVLLLFINRPLAGAASINATLGAIRAFAVDNAIQIGIVALPGAGGAGPAEALAEASPGGHVEYVLDATNRRDLTRRVDLLLAPAFGAHHFEFPAPADGMHTLSVGAPGVRLEATTTFQVTSRAIAVDSFHTPGGLVQPGQAISQPTWVEVQPAEDGAID